MSKVKIPEDKEGFVPVETVAAFFHVSISTVRVWVRQNVLPPHSYIKVGGVQRFNLEEVIKALAGAGVDVESAVDPFGTGKNLEKEEPEQEEPPLPESFDDEFPDEEEEDDSDLSGLNFGLDDYDEDDEDEDDA